MKLAISWTSDRSVIVADIFDNDILNLIPKDVMDDDSSTDPMPQLFFDSIDEADKFISDRLLPMGYHRQDFQLVNADELPWTKRFVVESGEKVYAVFQQIAEEIRFLGAKNVYLQQYYPSKEEIDSWKKQTKFPYYPR
jgi:hypothetical protein